jgi:hypothetical protein
MIYPSRKLSAVLPIALLMAPGIGLARAKPLEVRWNELAPMVTGHSVTLMLTDGMRVKGQAVAVREDALLLNVSSPVPGYEKGNGSVPRGSVVSIDVKRERGIGGRALGTVVGALGGMGIGVWVDARNNVLRHTVGEDVGTFIGIAAGGAAAGYFAGVAIDNKVTHIRVVP